MRENNPAFDGGLDQLAENEEGQRVAKIDEAQVEDQSDQADNDEVGGKVSQKD